jgi:predicted nucleic acid-binding protein
LNRPFDEQDQQRVRLETQAVLHILESCRIGRHQFVSSAALNVENAQTPNPERRHNVGILIDLANAHIDHTPEIDRRAAELFAMGFGKLDAYHVANAEAGGCDRLVTTDDKFLKQASRAADRLRIRISNPVQLIAEEGFL